MKEKKKRINKEKKRNLKNASNIQLLLGQTIYMIFLSLFVIHSHYKKGRPVFEAADLCWVVVVFVVDFILTQHGKAVPKTKDVKSWTPRTGMMDTWGTIRGRWTTASGCLTFPIYIFS